MIVKYVWITSLDIENAKSTSSSSAHEGGVLNVRGYKTQFMYNIRVFEDDIVDIPVSKYEQDNKTYVLSPCCTIIDPLSSVLSYITLCDIYDSYEILSEPVASNTRHKAKATFSKYDFVKKAVSEFGFIQGYSFGIKNNAIQKIIAEEHLYACIKSGIKVTELNYDYNRWSFSLGLYPGVLASDKLLLARYLLDSICEKYGTVVDFHTSRFLVRYRISTLMFSDELNRYMNDPINKHVKLYYNDNINMYNRAILCTDYSQFGYFEVGASCVDPYLATREILACYMSSEPSTALL